MDIVYLGDKSRIKFSSEVSNLGIEGMPSF
jgi:hypothetical protein